MPLQSAVDHLAKCMERLYHPEAGWIALTKFGHQSPGIMKLRTQIAEALVMEIEKDHVIERKAEVQ